jgi:hypothetical protein
MGIGMADFILKLYQQFMILWFVFFGLVFD